MSLSGLDNLDPRLLLLLIPIAAVQLGLMGFAAADLLRQCLAGRISVDDAYGRWPAWRKN